MSGWGRERSASGEPSKAKMMAMRSAEVAEGRVVTLKKSEGFIGLTCANNINGNPGVVVAGTKPGGLAEKASSQGLVLGTVIVRVNGIGCMTHQQAVQSINAAQDVVALEVHPERVDMVRVLPPRSWMYKRNPSGVWQQRFLALHWGAKDGCSLCYYYDPADSSPRGSIAMEKIVGVRDGGALTRDMCKEPLAIVGPGVPPEWGDDQQQQLSRAYFEVEISTGRVYTFAAATAAIASEWVGILTKQRWQAAAPAAGDRRGSGVPPSPRGSVTPAPAGGGYHDAIVARMRAAQLTSSQ